MQILLIKYLNRLIKGLIITQMTKISVLGNNIVIKNIRNNKILIFKINLNKKIHNKGTLIEHNKLLNNK
jgi:hypothetical protein